MTCVVKCKRRGPVTPSCPDAIYGEADNCAKAERIAIANTQFLATLPPAMLAHDDARIELGTEARPRPHSAGRGAHFDPISIFDAACRGRRGI